MYSTASLVLGKLPPLSRRKAKKLANRYRGSRRGQWYARYLLGDTKAFIVRHNRLVPSLLSTVRGPFGFQVVHDISVLPILKELGAQLGSDADCLFESPPELVFALPENPAGIN